MSIAEFAGRLQSKFRTQNYGYAGAIRTGQIVVENDLLVIKTPALSLDAPFPFYTCDSASSFATRELTRQGLQAATLQINIPRLPAGHSTLGHRVCLARNESGLYILGLATPIDKFLGLFPLVRMEEASWIMAHFEGDASNPFHRSPNAEIFEQPEWKLNGFDPRIRPLLAANQADGRLASVEMGLSLYRDANASYLFLIIVASIMRFDNNSKSVVIDWNDNLYLKLPVNDLPRLRDHLKAAKSRPMSLMTELDQLQMLARENMVPDPALSRRGQSLIIEAWPNVVEFLMKLPAEEIQSRYS